MLPEQLTHLSHSLPSTFSLQGQRPLWGSQVPRLPAGLQVQGLPKRQDGGKVSSEQPLSGNGPSSFPVPERARGRADSRAFPPPCRGCDPPTHLNRAPSTYPPTHPVTCLPIHSPIHASIHPSDKTWFLSSQSLQPSEDRQANRRYTCIGAMEEYTQRRCLGWGQGDR